jgi:hypothetical protein
MRDEIIGKLEEIGILHQDVIEKVSYYSVPFHPKLSLISLHRQTNNHIVDLFTIECDFVETVLIEKVDGVRYVVICFDEDEGYPLVCVSISEKTKGIYLHTEEEEEKRSYLGCCSGKVKRSKKDKANRITEGVCHKLGKNVCEDCGKHYCQKHIDRDKHECGDLLTGCHGTIKPKK